MLDHRVVDLACRIVSIVAPKQVATAQSLMELLDRLCVQHDVATLRRRDFDIRHVRSSLTFGTPHQTGTARGYQRRIFTRVFSFDHPSWDSYSRIGDYRLFSNV